MFTSTVHVGELPVKRPNDPELSGPSVRPKADVASALPTAEGRRGAMHSTRVGVRCSELLGHCIDS